MIRHTALKRLVETWSTRFASLSTVLPEGLGECGWHAAGFRERRPSRLVILEFAKQSRTSDVTESCGALTTA